MSVKTPLIFTNKKHPQKGVMSFVLGLISAVSLGLAIYLSYMNRGGTMARYGTITLFCLILSLTGFALGVVSRNEPDRYRFFPRLGIAINGGALGLIIVITYIAVYYPE